MLKVPGEFLFLHYCVCAAGGALRLVVEVHAENSGEVRLLDLWRAALVILGEKSRDFFEMKQ